MGLSLSLSSSQQSVDTYESDRWTWPPIIPKPVFRCNGLTRPMSPGSAVMWPNIRLIGISSFNHGYMTTTHKCIVRLEWHHLASCCLVPRRIRPWPIHHRRCRPICRHRLNPAHFSSAFYENLPRSKNLPTEHWKTLKRIVSATLKSRLSLPQRSYQANTYFSIARLNSSC